MIIPCSNFLTKPKGEKTFYKSHVRMRRYEQLMRSICELSKIFSFFMAFVILLSKNIETINRNIAAAIRCFIEFELCFNVCKESNLILELLFYITIIAGS